MIFIFVLIWFCLIVIYSVINISDMCSSFEEQKKIENMIKEIEGK